MSDMTCRKTMMRCQTPGMCAPHGGCSAGTLVHADVRYSDSTAPRDCLHGRQIGKCADCEVEKLEKVIADPEAVFVNMKRGTIAKPSLRSVVELYAGEVLNGEDVLQAEILRLRAELEAIKGHEPVAWTWQGTLDRLSNPRIYLPDGVVVFRDKSPSVPIPLYRLPPAKADEVSVGRALLGRLQERLDPHLDARDWGMICDLLASGKE